MESGAGLRDKVLTGLVLLVLRCATMALPIKSECASPGQNFPVVEKSYDLQTITDDGRSVLSNVRVTDSYQTQFFYSNCDNSNSNNRYYPNAPDGAIIFRTPSGQATTAHSMYTRVELRATRDWYAGKSFRYTQTGTFYVLENSATNSLIFAQIHGEKPGGSELLLVRWEDGKIVVAVKNFYGDQPALTSLISGVSIGERIEYSLRAVGTPSHLSVSLELSSGSSGSASKTFLMPTRGWCGIGLYFKAGNYNQDPHDDGSHSVLAYSQLDVSYEDGDGSGHGDGDGNQGLLLDGQGC